MHYCKSFHRHLRQLRKALPLLTPVRVQTLAGVGYCGECQLWEKKGKHQFLITVKRDLTKQESIDTLLHEWAHALTLEQTQGEDESHSDAWGINYAKCYRATEDL